MKTINTVFGQKNVEDLGVILPHEHIFINLLNQYVDSGDSTHDADKRISMEDLGDLKRNPYLFKDNLLVDEKNVAVEELKSASKYVNTFVDLTLNEIGRNVRKLQRVAKESGVNVIVGCGWYTDDTIPTYFDKMGERELADLLIKEFEDGIGGTGIKPGVIGEIGTSSPITEWETKSLKAAAAASLHTGAPIFVHTDIWGKEGLKVVDILSDCGLEPDKICICHVDVLIDIDYIEKLLKRGVFIEFDNFGKEFFMNDPDNPERRFYTDIERIKALKLLTEEGYTNRILLSNDICLKMMLKKYGGLGFDHIHRDIVPMMQSLGVSKEDVRTMIVDNPKRFLGGVK